MNTSSRRPKIIVIGGPNGAGKSTIAPRVLRGELKLAEFVNADVIATGLNAYAPEKVALSAGRIMIARLRELRDAKSDFAFETTLSSRSFAPFITDAIRFQGYEFHLVFLTLPDAEMAVSRVAMRMKQGGHSVPPDDIRRRFARGVSNFFELYQSLATTWKIYDSSMPGHPRLVASLSDSGTVKVYDSSTLKRVKALASHAEDEKA